MNAEEADFDKRKSYKESLIKCLETNPLTKDKSPTEFVLLQDLFRLVASEWIVFSTYVDRELNNIERWFENSVEQCSRARLHYLLHKLMAIHRRVTKYDALIHNQLHQCPAHWKLEHGESAGACPAAALLGRSSSAELPFQLASSSVQSPLMDFVQVLELFAHNKNRIKEAIEVATSLLSVNLNDLVLKQNTLSEARNASLVFLTAVTSVFLPFTAVAAAMTIPMDERNWQIGGGDQWKFWTTGFCFMAFVIGSFLGVYVHHTLKVKGETFNGVAMILLEKGKDLGAFTKWRLNGGASRGGSENSQLLP